MKVISAVLFVLGSFMVKSTVEGYHVMDYYPSRNCRSGLMDVEKIPHCLKICFENKPECGGKWEPVKVGFCWACCEKSDNDEEYIVIK